MIDIKKEVAQALKHKGPIVALETTILTHGLPYPQNLQTAFALEKAVEEEGAVPALIGALGGKIKVGLSREELEKLVGVRGEKIQARFLPLIHVRQWSGGVTVSAVLVISHLLGIRVFSTGGIGGVHRNLEINPDISEDLIALSRNPVAVISAGAKAILDLSRTLEMLETLGVPVLGFQTGEFPAFYTRFSGLPIPRVESEEEVVDMMWTSWSILKKESAIVIANPPPRDSELPGDFLKKIIEDAVNEAKSREVKGKDLTPFLLDFLDKKSGGRTVKTNVALAESNARLAARIAVAFAKASGKMRQSGAT